MASASRIAVAISNDVDSLAAARTVAARVSDELDGAAPHLAVLFLSVHHAGEVEEAVAGIADGLRPRHLIGSTVESAIGGGVEYEGRPAMILWAAMLPDARIVSAHLRFEETPDGFLFHGAPWTAGAREPATLLLLADPFSFPTDVFLGRVAEECAALQVLGGMASGASGPGDNCLVLGSNVLHDGAAAVLLSGGVRVEPVVSQGCAPFGKPLVITRAEENLIFELGGRPALEKLNEQLSELSTAEQAHLSRGLHLGLAIDARKEEHRRGDFLVRNVIGYYQERNALVVAERVRAGQTVQFHLRDAESASEDLHLLLQAERAQGSPAMGGLLFSSNGRGTRFFDEPNHDARAITEELGNIPLAGFFAAGEVGPVGGRNFLHGFTASLALFYPK